MQLKKWLASALCTALMLSSAGMTAAADNSVTTLYAGDVNLDEQVDTLDVLLLQKHLLGLTSFDEEDAALCADATADGEVDIFDLGLLKQMVLGEKQIALDGEFIPAPIKDFYGSMPTQGTGKLMVFYVDFPDCQYDYEPTVRQLEDICFGKTPQDNAANPNYPFESISDYYCRASKGAFLLDGSVYRYTAKNPISYYSGDSEKTLLMTELFQYYNRFVDFSQFDGDGDGFIDSILVSVPGTAPDEDWWACSGMNYSNLEADGVKIGHVTTGSDQVVSADDHKNFVSTYAHETSHCMGLPDYYLYHTEDFEGFHGEAGCELMDSDAYSDLCCFSKLMLGWYREKQVMVYDTVRGGEQTFVLREAQSSRGNCLILPCGALDGNYNSEYMMLEFNTDKQNNSGINRDMTALYGFTEANGIRAFHVQAQAEVKYDYKWLSYQTDSSDQKSPDDQIRLIRLVNDEEGGAVLKTGDVLSGSISGFHWYGTDGYQTVETGYTVTIGELTDGGYTVTVSR